MIGWGKYRTEEEIAYAINIQPYKKRPDSPIVDWEPSKVAMALLTGYEVEEEYEVGDKVIYFKEGEFQGEIFTVRAIDTINGDTVLKMKETHETLVYTNSKNIRHATPEEIKVEKERQVWAGIGRKVQEFRDGDIGINKNECKVTGRNTLWATYQNDHLKGFYPAESFITFGSDTE